MKKTKKLIVMVMACVMLFGAALTVNAAGCIHNLQAFTDTTRTENVCMTHARCTITTVTTTTGGECIYCGALFNVKTNSSSTHSY